MAERAQIRHYVSHCVLKRGGRTLPLFMDYHDELKLPSEAIQQIT